MKTIKEKMKPTILENAARVCSERYFKKESFFTLYVMPVMRIINIIFLVLGVFMLAGSSFLFESTIYAFNGFFWIIALAVPPLISNYIKNKIESKHEFFEWDKRERKKKRDFLTILTLIVFFFTYLAMFILTVLYFDYREKELSKLNGTELIDLSLRLFYGVLFMLNSIYTVQLHNKVYEDYLIIDDFNYDISEKPQNWDSEYKRTSFDNFFYH